MYPAGLGNDVELLGPDAEPVIAGEPGAELRSQRGCERHGVTRRARTFRYRCGYHPHPYRKVLDVTR